MHFIDTDMFNYYHSRIINKALSQFVWENLPETCDRLFLEKKLLFEGMITKCEIKKWLSSGYVSNETEELESRDD